MAADDAPFLLWLLNSSSTRGVGQPLRVETKLRAGILVRVALGGDLRQRDRVVALREDSPVPTPIILQSPLAVPPKTCGRSPYSPDCTVYSIELSTFTTLRVSPPNEDPQLYPLGDLGSLRHSA
jgi:hypothetical protein